MFTLSASSFLSGFSLHTIGIFAFQLQTTNGDSSKLMVVFMGIAAISLLVLALVVVGVLLALVVVGLKARAAVAKTVVEVKTKAYPIIEKTNVLVGDLSPTIKGIAEKTHILIGELSPKITGIGDDLHGITTRARNMVEFTEGKLHDFAPAIDAARETFMEANATARSASDMTARQVERVNGIVTVVLDWTNHVPVQILEVMSIPGRLLGDSAKGLQVRALSFLNATKNFMTKLTQRSSSGTAGMRTVSSRRQ